MMSSPMGEAIRREQLLPFAAYPFSDKFAWVADKYGVSWQLNLERN